MRALLFIVSLSLVALVQGCKIQSSGAESAGFNAFGPVSAHIAVSPPLTLAASGRFSARVPADTIVSPPSADFRFALFGEGESGDVSRSAYVALSELPSSGWRWEMESWARTESLQYSKLTAVGRYWTVQIFPVLPAEDWFGELWALNGRTTPEFWLAKHWSATPDEETRIVAEYREPAPACMREELRAYAESRNNREFPPLQGKALRARCEREMDEFSARADAMIHLDENLSLPLAEGGAKLRLPDSRPNMRNLVGVAEMVRVDMSSR
ncbi:MAG: DUF4851 domain-containing protein [Desulfovibrio sp.]|jgi:hypothetical protein|nr:DUF4851 domain-containing protein [Desulfovibrio sp.]